MHAKKMIKVSRNVNNWKLVRLKYVRINIIIQTKQY